MKVISLCLEIKSCLVSIEKDKAKRPWIRIRHAITCTYNPTKPTSLQDLQRKLWHLSALHFPIGRKKHRPPPFFYVCEWKNHKSLAKCFKFKYSIFNQILKAFLTTGESRHMATIHPFSLAYPVKVAVRQRRSPLHRCVAHTPRFFPNVW